MTGGVEFPLRWTDEARMIVRWRIERAQVRDYAVTLTALDAGRHRPCASTTGYTRDGTKQPAIIFHDGTLREGLRAAQLEVKHGWAEMIEGWRR